MQSSRRSFTGHEPNQRELPSRAVQQPSSHFNTNPSFLIDDDVPPQVLPKASMYSFRYLDSFSSPRESVRRSPASKLDSTTNHDEVEKLDNFHNLDYWNTEVEDYFGASVPQIEEAIGSIANS